MAIRLLHVYDGPRFSRSQIARLSWGAEAAMSVSVVTADKALSIIDKQCLDVVLLEVPHDRLSAYETLAAIQRRAPELPIVVHADRDCACSMACAAQLGAHGFLAVGAPYHLYVTSIGRAAMGEYIWSRDQLQRIAAAIVRAHAMAHHSTACMQAAVAASASQNWESAGANAVIPAIRRRLARMILCSARGFTQGEQAVEAAIRLGLTLSEIEDLLDWAENNDRCDQS